MHITRNIHVAALLPLLAFAACTTPAAPTNSLQGTWRLISGTTIEKNDTVTTDYTAGKSFIKIINGSHFAFTGHDLVKGKDSANAFFTSGAGTYTLIDGNYTEKLEYCTGRAWEGNEFKFNITIANDTLVQQGVEKVEAAGVDRINIERYVRVN
ncbi:hypothetical protein [uncultured Chitinophaga sp.]|uniref:hypothetical protein n=1 Tax=uncultured Chitinophaga sp. TaxID=339340 RepID=UPI0025CBF508|nr:hypothetical protein [uncultured Chitinophaga sp.]